MIEIKEIGTYLPIDKDGYFISESSKDKIKEPWSTLLEDTLLKLRDEFSTQIKSIYVRGSVSKGEALEYISDLDSVIITYNTAPDFNSERKKEVTKTLLNKYSFAENIELNHFSEADLLERQGMPFLLKTYGVCVYGEDILAKIPNFHSNSNPAYLLKGLSKNIQDAKKDLVEINSTQLLKDTCSWIMKRIVRSGCELVFPKSRKYSRDLYPCYKVFSEHYPEKEQSMKDALYLALNPTDNKEQIMSLVNTLGEWIVNEYIKV